ncbi:MAG: 50S ribosomal protein L9 [Phycisphaerae bacterium]|nr:50S ribosomal protein L9 [Phycisphaerae bacterium]
MKVLLCDDIDKLGYLGDIVEVKTGYARNYLLPQGLAKVPTEGNIRSLAGEKAARAEQRKLERRRLEKVTAAVEGAEVVLSRLANEQGHLFGSVTEKDIGENLRAQGFEVADEMIRLGEHLKEVGTHEISLKLASDLTAKVKVVVVAEGQPVEADSEQKPQE